MGSVSTPRARRRIPDATSFGDTPLSILLIDDDEDDYVLTRDVVSHMQGLVAKLAWASTYEAGLAALQQGDSDVCLLDYRLGEDDGLELLDAARRSGCEVPIIFITGCAERDTDVAALRRGAGDYLAKSELSAPALARSIRFALERAHFKVSLQTTEERYRRIVETTTEGVWLVDTDASTLFVNRRMGEILGRPPGEFTGKPPCAVLGEEARASLAATEETLRRGSSCHLELELMRVDGGKVWTAVDANGLFDAAGRYEGALGMVRDITQGREAEAERARLEEQLRRKNMDLEERNRQLVEASRMKSEFLANMSHELRTPLNAIIGFAELMHDGKAGPLAADHKEFLGDILASGRHLLGLINAVLDLSKVEAGKVDIRLERIDPRRIIEEVRDVLSAEAARTRTRVDFESDPTLGTVVTDPKLLRQVVYNYLSNALKFTNGGGAVRIRLFGVGAMFRVEVADDGIGIAPEDVARLFVPFQQLDSSAAKKYGGTGLGLALTRRVVAAQRGHVGVTSTLGVGSVFFAELPREPSADEVPGPAGAIT